LQETAVVSNSGAPGGGGGAFQPETTLGYKWKLVDPITLGLSGGVGYNSGAVGSSGSLANTVVGAYYVFNATADLKLSSKWTWNAIAARYRNAFDETWATPEVTTGLTYAIDARQAVYTAVGYAWKDTGNGAGLLGDKINVAVGYKLGF
jgi:hypothetical protein